MMVQFMKKVRRHSRLRKVKEGDGHRLKKYRLWHVFTHSLFHVEITDKATGETTRYAVKSRYFTEEPVVDLYEEGRHVAYSKLPAMLPAGRGVLEVNRNAIGINGMYYRTDCEHTFSVYPERRSVRGMRMWVDRRFPKVSAVIGFFAVVILLVSITVGAIQLLESLSVIPWVAETIGEFQSPVALSAGANVTIGLAAVLAGIERTLMLRNHWLIDLENMNTGEGG